MEHVTFLEKYSVKEALQQSVGEIVNDTIHLTPDVVKEIASIVTVHPIDISVSILRHDTGISLTTEAQLVAHLVCSRCLQEFDQQIDGSEEEEYTQTRVDEDDDAGLISRQLTINITQQVIDTLGASIPVFPLHDTKCQGLCQTCGVDLNTMPGHYDQFPEHKPADPLVNRPRIV